MISEKSLRNLVKALFVGAKSVKGPGPLNVSSSNPVRSTTSRRNERVGFALTKSTMLPLKVVTLVGDFVGAEVAVVGLPVDEVGIPVAGANVGVDDGPEVGPEVGLVVRESNVGFMGCDGLNTGAGDGASEGPNPSCLGQKGSSKGVGPFACNFLSE